MATASVIILAIERRPQVAGTHNTMLYVRVYNIGPCRYNESCLHGCIIASKILFLAESVCDVVDIKKSKRFNSPSNILGVKCIICAF